MLKFLTVFGMKFNYKNRHVYEQQKRPKRKRPSCKFTVVNEAELLDLLYNNPFRTAERLHREQLRKRDENKRLEQSLKSRFKYLFKKLTKTFSNMKNQRINEAATITAENFRYNLIEDLSNGIDENKQKISSLLEQLDWTKFDASNKGTIKDSFNLMLAENETVSNQLDEEEAKVDAIAKNEGKAKAKKALSLFEALAKCKTDEEKLQVIAQYS